MARDPESQRTADGVVVSPLCEVEAVAVVSSSGKMRWESPVCGRLRATPLAQKKTPQWTPPDTQSRAVTQGGHRGGGAVLPPLWH